MCKGIKITYFTQIKASFRKTENALTHSLFSNPPMDISRIPNRFRHFLIIVHTNLANYLWNNFCDICIFICKCIVVTIGYLICLGSFNSMGPASNVGIYH